LQGQSYSQATPVLIGSGSHNHIILPVADQLPETIARVELDHRQKMFLLRPENDTVANLINLATKTNDENNNTVDDPPWPLPAGSGVNIGEHLFTINFSGGQG
jgi:hypothetical protein